LDDKVSPPSAWRPKGRAVVIAFNQGSTQGTNSETEAPRQGKKAGPDLLQRILRIKPGLLRRLLVVILALAALVAIWGVISYYWTNYLWYKEVGHTNVFWTPFLGRLLVGLFFALIFFALFYGSLWLARKLSPRFRPVEAEHSGNVLELVTRRRWSGRVLVAVSAVVAIIVGISYGGRWQEVLLFLNRQAFGYADPLFGKDASFFVYSLPLWNMLVNFVLLVTVLTFIFTVLTYLGDRAITLAAKNRISSAPHVKAHLSVLLAVFMLAKAADYALQRWELVYSQRGFTSGASYTDVHASLPVLYILAIVSLIAAALFLVNLLFRGWKIPAVALALMLLFWIFAGKVAPAAVQQFQVKPNEIAKESEYIAKNIEATRWAFGLADASRVSLAASSDLKAAEVIASGATIDNIRIWEPRPAKDTYSQIQEIRLYYSFNDVDVDRYILDGKLRQVLISARELDQTQLGEQSQTWVNQHLSYTHGYGFVLSPVNEAAPGGRPVLFVSNIPPVTTTSGITITRPEIYYGELGNSFVVVNTNTQEFDYPQGDANVYTTYKGDGGIPVGGTWRQAAFAFRLGSKNILFSSSITDESRVMFRRTLWERVEALAPFLAYDYDPYLVVRADGSLVWMWDAYATTNLFPYSEPWADSGGPVANHIPSGTNYARNSVKVVIDAYDGGMTFYQMDPQESITNAWGKIYEGLFTPAEQMPADIRAHMRYPENLYSVQADVLTKYHMTDPQIFYAQEDAWEIPVEQYQGSEAPTVPYYEVLALPGETEAESALILPFTPRNKGNMSAMLVARQDGEHYGELIVVDFPKSKQVDGPAQIEAQISNDPVISSQLTLWDQAGSSVIRGNLLVVPMGQSIVYFEPVYLQAEQENTIPELKRVIVAYGNRIAMEPTVGEALSKIFGESISTGTTPSTSGSTTTTLPGGTTPTTAPGGATTATTIASGGLPTDAASLIALANRDYLSALEALKAGNWTEYGRLIEELGRVLEALAAR
jgi:uncharacterized membrane protein (UPF0182 family)